MRRVWLSVLGLCLAAIACKSHGKYGDYIGPVNAQSIQGIAVSTTPPTNGQVLEYQSGSTSYVATTLGSSSGGTPTGTGFRYVASGTENATAVGLSGDGTIGALSGSNVPLTLATVNSNTGAFGDSSHTLSVTANAKGLLTAVSTNAIAITNANLTSGAYSNITGTGTLTSGATGSGFTVALGTSTVTGTLGVANGGTGVTLLYGALTTIASGTTTLSQATVQRVLISTTGGTSATAAFPASPNNGDAIWVHTSGTTVTSVAQISPNGNSIETPLTPGNTSSGTINLGTNPGVSALFIYESSGTLWRLWQ